MKDYIVRALIFAIVLFAMGVASDRLQEARKPKLRSSFYEHMGCLRGGLWLSENKFLVFKDGQAERFVEYCQSLEK